MDKMLSEIIKDTINGEKHLGDNLKRLCIEYLERLEENNG